LILTPAFLIGNIPLVSYVKTLAQGFFTLVFKYGFKANFKLTESKQDIKTLINENTDKIDLIVCNHTSTLDFLILMSYLQEFQIDSYNFVLKNQITYVPGFGFIMYTNPDVKLNRNWEQDKDTLAKQLDGIKTNGKKQVIIIFPEGTRLNEKKLKEGQEFSVKNNLPVYENLMVPKSKGLWFITNHLSKTNRLGRIWDTTIILPKFIGKDIGLKDILGKTLGDINMIWREVTLPENYEDNETFKTWLLNIWITKDSFIKNYNQIFYHQLESNLSLKHSTKLLLVIFLLSALGIGFNKYGRYYLSISFILSYVFIFFKL
jgi:1-acyl-sn-glycerol-3-phosphate acyltransferase